MHPRFPTQLTQNTLLGYLPVALWIIRWSRVIIRVIGSRSAAWFLQNKISLAKRTVFLGLYITSSVTALLVHGASRQTQYICIKFEQRRPNVLDIGPPLYSCHTNVLYLLEWWHYMWIQCHYYVHHACHLNSEMILIDLEYKDMFLSAMTFV